MLDNEQDFVLVDQSDLRIDFPEKSPQEVAQIKEWLQPTDYLGESSDFHKHLAAHVPGTGEWIKKTAEYQKWHDSTTHGALWMKAVAGAGKSVLAARLIAQLQEHEPQTPVLFFFFRQIIASNHDAHSMVRDWMAQLLPSSTYLQIQLQKLKDNKRKSKDIAFSELWQTLLDALRLFDKIYCVIDALDELDHDHTQPLLQHLVALGNMRPGAIKLLMTSRPLPQIQKDLNRASILQVRLEDRQVNRDIALFVEHRLLQATHLAESTREAIKRSIEDRVHPSFLYARLMINELLDGNSDSLGLNGVQSALLSLPPSLENMYSQMLYDHSQLASVPQERQLLILQLTTHASRPLRLLEIATVLDFLDMNDGKNKHGDTKNLTRMSCGPLLEILNDETVSIIHHSFTEFLTDSDRKPRILADSLSNPFPVIDSIETHELMALVCVRYLISGCFESWEFKTEWGSTSARDTMANEGKSLRLQYPFLDYAAQNWDYHLRRLPEINGPLLDNLNRFLQTGNTAFRVWVGAVIDPSYDSTLFSPLHAAAWVGLTVYAEELISAGHDINALADNEQTPLILAAKQGHADIVALLLEHGAPPDEPDKFGLKPLHYAAQSNYHTIVQLLLDAGVSPLTGRTKDWPPRRCGNARLCVGDTPLRYASQDGCVEAIQAMLPHLRSEDLNESFLLAARKGHLPLVRCLLDDRRIDLISEVGGKALLRAGNGPHLEVIELLLDRGATLNYRPKYSNIEVVGSDPDERESDTLLLAICSSCWLIDKNPDSLMLEKCVDLALRAGCHVDDAGPNGRTALHYCVLKGLSLAEKLLQNGADVNAKDRMGNTPLHLFRTSRGTAILEVLIRYGARWDIARDSDGKTPLHTCVEGFSLYENLECLQPYVQNWDIPDPRGNTPLHLARHGPEGLSKALIAMGADVNWRNHAGEVPLHTIGMSSSSAKSISEMLLAAGADIEARDNNGKTWFLRTAELDKYSSPGEIKHAMDLGADIQVTDWAGNNALHLVCNRHCSLSSLQNLLKAGVNPLHRNHKGDTLFHTLLRRCFEYPKGSFQPLFDMIRATGIELRATNYQGQTVLHVACSMPQEGYHRSMLFGADQNPLELLPEWDFEAMMNTSDHEGRLPIHVAVAVSEDLVAWLIRKDANLMARTYKGHNVLHLAAMARQANIIGLLLENYTDTQREEVVNQSDSDGWTPLHHACLSGRTESVNLLLIAGANVTVKDYEDYTPLHVCGKYAKGHTDLNEERNWDTDHYSITSEAQVRHVTDIIRLLVRHGADITAITKKGRTPMDVAIDHKLSEMVITLEELHAITKVSSPLTGRGRTSVGQLYFAATRRDAESLIHEITQSEVMNDNPLGVCEWLLKLGAYHTLEELANRGFVFRGQRQTRRQDFLTILARWGFIHMFEKLGNMHGDTEWVNGCFSIPYQDAESILPFALTIAQRTEPSMDLLRLVVDKFQADINITVPYLRHDGRPSPSVLHTLVGGHHWWQTQAVRYVLEHGGDARMIQDGRSPLHIAVQGGYRRLGIVKLLLEHGADPNAADSLGDTPLALAARDLDMVRLLLQHGADVTQGKPPILARAIQNHDVDIVRVILETGIDCNRSFEDPVSHPPEDQDNISIAFYINGMEEKRKVLQQSPLYLAAILKNSRGKEPIYQRAKAIVQLLLNHGANPFQPYENTTLLHNLLDEGSIYDPFLSIPSLDIEHRDGRRRTLLLAACEANEEIRRFCYSLDTAHRIELIHKLLDMGADITATNSNGDTVLHLLVRAFETKDQNKLSEDLLPVIVAKHPSVCNDPNSDGITPLHLAAQQESLIIVEALIQAGADIHSTDPHGNTLLHHLAKYLTPTRDRTRPYALRLLDRGLDINTRNKNGDTPLARYVQDSISRVQTLREEEHQQLIQKLRDDGADFLTINNAGENLLHIMARVSMDTECHENAAKAFTVLMEMGVDPFLEDSHQRTPVDVAAAYGKTAILELFQKKPQATVTD